MLFVIKRPQVSLLLDDNSLLCKYIISLHMVIFNSSSKGCIISLRIQMFIFILRGNGEMSQMLQR